MRLPVGEGVSRTTTSSLKPNQRVVSVASIRSALGSEATIFQPMSCAACKARGKAASGDWLRQDCFWTALNFFADYPDDRVPLLDLSSKLIEKDYYQIESEPAFGDLVALVDSERKIKHVCVYIADDVVFTKNGGHFMQPWALMKISDMMAKYPADPPLEKAILRPKKG